MEQQLEEEPFSHHCETSYAESLLRDWERRCFSKNKKDPVNLYHLAFTRWLEKRYSEIYQKLPERYEIVDTNEFHSMQSVLTRVMKRSIPVSVVELYSNGFFERYYIVHNRDISSRVRLHKGI